MNLSEIGEFDLLKQYILPQSNLTKKNDNNDAAFVMDSGGESLIWTIDPLPTPIAWLLGIKDPKILGWYTAIINLSDIAANGGEPEGLLVSVELPEDTKLDFFLKYTEGLTLASEKFDAPILGGNVKSSNKFKATGTALGRVKGKLLTRTGIRPGYKIILIGQTGYFWAATLAHRYAFTTPEPLGEKLNNSLCYPIPQIKAGKILSDQPFHIACMDSSDGILSCCYQLACINNVEIVLHEDIQWNLPDEIVDIYLKNKIEINTACYSWGEWQLVCAVSQENQGLLINSLGKNGIPYTIIGDVQHGYSNVFSAKSGRPINKSLLNERFKTELGEENVDNIIKHFLRQQVFI